MKKNAFTLIELLVVISIIALLIGILLPALGAARRTARQMQNSTQIRGIHSGLVLFAQGNNTYYPGAASNGSLIDAVGGTAPVSAYATGTQTTNGTDDDTGRAVGYRFRELLEDNYFTGEYIISPSETKTEWDSGSVSTDNFSYAMLDFGVVQRRNEWRETSNSEAVVLGDRAIDNADGAAEIKSVHTNPAAGTNEWRGSVGWNDNHVTFESDEVVDTQMGSASNTDDDLFVATDGSAASDNAVLGYDGVDGTDYIEGD